MNHIKLIKSEQEHEQALARLMHLMDVDPGPGTAEADELDVLAVLIERYEEELFPMDLPDPVEAIKYRMDQEGLKNKDLIPYIGSAPKVSEVLKGKRQLSLNMIRKLNDGLGIPAKVLIREPAQQMAKDKDIDWQAFPLSDMRKHGYFEGFTGSLQELREYAAEKVGKLLSSVPSGFDLQPALLRTTAHLRSNDKETDPYALWAWQVRVLQKAQEEQLPVNYGRGTVDLDWMRQLAQLSWSNQGPQLAVEYLNRHGIHLIIEKHLPKTYLDGAVCVNANGNPVIALTLRYDRLDNFWFTLMHELAHVALHVDGAEIWFIDDLDAESADRVEQEADALAQEAFVPEEAWSPLTVFDADAVNELARRLNIYPGIIAGRLRHELADHRLFGTAFRDKVRDKLPGLCA
jgi:HTH-type transcriptional regulator/antitoxin HigA